MRRYANMVELPELILDDVPMEESACGTLQFTSDDKATLRADFAVTLIADEDDWEIKEVTFYRRRWVNERVITRLDKLTQGLYEKAVAYLTSDRICKECIDQHVRDTFSEVVEDMAEDRAMEMIH